MMDVNLAVAWKAICEGDLDVLAHELGMIPKEVNDGAKKDCGFSETRGGDDDLSRPDISFKEEAYRQKDGEGRY